MVSLGLCVLLVFTICSAAAFIFSPRSMDSVAFGRQVIREQRLIVSAAVFLNEKDFSEHGKNFTDRVQIQLANAGYLLNSPALRELGYNIDFRVGYITTTPNFSLQNLDRCDRIEFEMRASAVPVNLYILATMDLSTRPNGNIVGGVSNSVNCLMYSVRLDQCGLILVHEIIHSVFSASHVSRVFGECNQKKFNVMAELYDRVCPTLALTEMMTGLECDLLRDFSHSIYNYRVFKAEFPRYNSTSLDRSTSLNHTFARSVVAEHNTNPFLNRARFPLVHGEYVQIFDRFAKPASLSLLGSYSTCSVSAWSRPIAISSNSAPYKVFKRTRQCVCANYFDKCDPHISLKEYDVKINIEFQPPGRNGFEAARSQKRRANCTTLNMCTYFCGKIDYERIIVPHGSACLVDSGSEGACVEGACMLLDMLYPLPQHGLSETITTPIDSILSRMDVDLMLSCQVSSNTLFGAITTRNFLGFLNATSFAQHYASYPVTFMKANGSSSVAAVGHKFCARLLEYATINSVDKSSRATVTVIRNSQVEAKYDMANKYSTCTYNYNSIVKRAPMNAFTCDKYIKEAVPTDEFEHPEPFGIF